MQDRDNGEREAVRDRGEKEVPVGIEAGAEGAADDVEDAGERRPDGGLPESLTFVTLCVLCRYLVSFYDLRSGVALDGVYGFRFPFSSYS